MKGIGLFLVLLLLFSPAFLSGEGNTDKPQKGEHHFKLHKIWQLDSAGEETFSRIAQVEIAENDRVYVYDNKNGRYYILAADGKLVAAFGKRGEGPGEIRRIVQAPVFPIGEKVVVQDAGKLHFFDAKGTYINSVNNNENTRPVIQFLDETKFLSAPASLLDAPGGKAKISIVDIKSGEQKEILQFTAFEGTAVQEGRTQAKVVHPALTPMMVLGYDNGRLYYGMNSVYKINIADITGKKINEFSMQRERRKVSEKVKFDVMWRAAKGRAPKAMVEDLAKKMPSDITHFSQLEVHNGLIYVYMSYYDRKNIQNIDIFTPEGKYLYRAVIAAPADERMVLMPQIRKGYLYLVTENADGDQRVGKYKVLLPKN